ncbi:MAG TPA: biotin carboxylase N-terminal domain-containing protein [Burkholderiaceae bacterium]|nr:biotin carboxylase N-terminal domain-containing protein [Burkholderiaceae bacterium]
MFRTLLIANRGEICCRVAATARRLGVRTVAVYSDADAASAHVAACDEAIRVGGPAASDSYLRIDRIVAAARASGADAIHPGYGFLSESAAFATACGDAGLTFVGPPARAIEAMGDKRQAKQLMRAASVPLIPGYDGQDDSVATLRSEAARIGFPVLIKAALGGGGRGIRVVTAPDEFEAALASCRREALAAFGNDRVLLERYLPDPRHVEIQVFADQHGGCIWLGERDCSAQRRHQKVVEESPAPGLAPEVRLQMGQAAVTAARAVGYTGAGTVEFLVTAGGQFYFMEMNTRLQVEHPVTEMVTGLDLVEWQLRVAAGEPLPLQQDQVRLRGHSIEARIYAEDPDRDFVPATGQVHYLGLPPHVAFAIRAGGADGGEPAPVRIDGSVRAGDRVTPYYDAMIAKVIVWGIDREQALARMREALQQTILVGLTSNVEFLVRLVRNADFSSGRVDTGLIGREMPSLTDPGDPFEPHLVAAALAHVLVEEARAQSADPWSNRQGWRLNGIAARRVWLRCGAASHEATIEYLAQGPLLASGAWRSPLAIDASEGARLRLRLGEQVMAADVVRDGDVLHVFAGAVHRAFALVDPVGAAGEADQDEDRLCAPMPGKIIAIHASAGDRVRRGQLLLVMEAMKMEHSIVAPHDGVLEQLRYRVGDQVEEGATLVALRAADEIPLSRAGGGADETPLSRAAGQGRGRG